MGEVEMSGYDMKLYALMLAATNFVLSWTLTQPVFSLYVTGLGASVVQVGTLFSLMSFIPLVIRIPMSVIAERIGRIRMLLLGLFITATSSLLYANARSFSHVLLITVYTSIANGGFNQTAMSTVSDAAPGNRQGDAMGRYLTFLGFGMMVGPAMCSYLVNVMSYSQLFYLSALFPTIGILLILFLAPDVPRMVTSAEASSEVGTMESLRMIFRNRNVMLLSYCRASFSTAQAIFIALFSIYAVQQLGISESTVALLFTLRGFSNTLSRFPAGRISDSIGRRIPMLAAYGILVISFFIIAFFESVYMMGVALVLYGLCWGTRAVSEWAFLTDHVEPEIKTISISYLSSVFGFGSTIGSLAAGFLATIFPFSTIFLFGAALNLGAIPAVLSMKRSLR
jgi:predicted MFS family arabinose efflux permease